jgi:transcriptional regulator with XRE-family HTH domain
MNDRTERAAYWMGRRIASRRALLGLSGGAFAARIGVSRVSLSRIENGHVENINAATLAKIAAELGVTMEYVLFGDETTEDHPAASGALLARAA